MVRVVLDGDGCLRSLSVTGHASGEAGSFGENAVCAAVTGIVRAGAEAIAGHRSIRATGAAARPGELVVRVTEREQEDAGWLRGVSDVILTGVGRIARDEPDEVQLSITKRGEVHGSQEGRWQQ